MRRGWLDRHARYAHVHMQFGLARYHHTDTTTCLFFLSACIMASEDPPAVQPTSSAKLKDLIKESMREIMQENPSLCRSGPSNGKQQH